jgi:hypothetical protein
MPCLSNVLLAASRASLDFGIRDLHLTDFADPLFQLELFRGGLNLVGNGKQMGRDILLSLIREPLDP